MTCRVCDSNSNTSCIHFGARSCKACAAFFRRTISMKLDYSCIKDETCYQQLENGFRIVCRYCRLQKCYQVGMSAELVKSKKERIRYIRMSKGLVKREAGDKEKEEEFVEDCGENASCSHNSNSEPEQPIYREMSSCSTTSTVSNLDAHSQSVFSQIVNLEMDLNDRRRLLYGDYKMRNIFAEKTSCPYERSSLKVYNYKSNQGMSKQDFVTLLDYAKALPGFNSLNYLDKNYCFRLMCGADFVLSCAFYTYKCGLEENILVLCDGSYIPMVPEPMTGNEENSQLLFENQDDLIKYRTIMPLLKSQWKICHPFSNLKPTFEEFAVLKAICIWHVSYYRLSENGRNVSKHQKNLLMKALHYACEISCDPDDDVEEKFGNLLLGLNYIMEQIQTVVSSFVMISFFGIMNIDSLMVDMTHFW